MNSRWLCLLGVLAIYAMTSSASTATITVGSGESIQAAIDSAVNGDQVVVYPGTYAERINFNGKAIEVVSIAGPLSTTIDGTGLGGSVVTFDSYESAASILDGFRITGGTGTLEGPATMGGGIYIDLAGPVVRNCIVEQNEAGAGGGIAARTAWAMIANCIVRNNVATSNNTGFGGGGIYATYDNTIINCTIADNSVPGGHGGGIALSGGSASVVNCLILRNEAYLGAGARNNSTDALFINCTFHGNVAESAGAAVLGMYSAATTMMSNCILDNNFATYGGELYTMSSASFDVWNCAIRDIPADPSRGIIELDLPFVDPDNDDFRLRSDSPAINAGANDLLPSDMADLDNDLDMTEQLPVDIRCHIGEVWQQRIVAGTVDLGALERQDAVESPDSCDGDSNNDTLVDIFDLLMLIDQWGACAAVCTADFTDDGQVNLFDLIMLLDNWGVCSP